MTTTDIDNEVRNEFDAIVEQVKRVGCVDRGEGLQPMHVYLDGSGRCQCGNGPKLSERRME
jgi:hypothetical protein